jgi:hypothetical protein
MCMEMRSNEDVDVRICGPLVAKTARIQLAAASRCMACDASILSSTSEGAVLAWPNTMHCTPGDDTAQHSLSPSRPSCHPSLRSSSKKQQSASAYRLQQKRYCCAFTQCYALDTEQWLHATHVHMYNNRNSNSLSLARLHSGPELITHGTWCIAASPAHCVSSSVQQAQSHSLFLIR